MGQGDRCSRTAQHCSAWASVRRAEGRTGGKRKTVTLGGVPGHHTGGRLWTPHPHPPRPSCFSCRSDAPEEALLAAVFTENLDFDHSLSMCQGAPHTRPCARLWRYLLSRSGPGLAEDRVCLQRRQMINKQSPRHPQPKVPGRGDWRQGCVVPSDVPVPIPASCEDVPSRVKAPTQMGFS